MLADDIADTAGRSVQIIYSDAIKTFPFILSYDARRPFPPNKALASRLDEKNKEKNLTKSNTGSI